MGSVEKRVLHGRVRWVARYRDLAGAQRSKTLDRKVDAERFLVSVESSLDIGTYVDPQRGRLTVGQAAADWLTRQPHLKPSTAARYTGIVRQHIEPQWGPVRLADVEHGAIQRWVTSLADLRAPATVRKAHRVLSLILAAAVRDGRLSRNPAERIHLPRVAVDEQRYLTHAQVAALADAFGRPPDASKHRRLSERDNPDYRLAVLFLAYTGVRFGELAALKVRRLDLARRRATIAESVTAVQGKGLVWSLPKGHERRQVPLPAFLVAELADHVKDRRPDDLVFRGARSGSVLRASIFRRAGFDRAAAQVGAEGLHPHELRHTAASLAIASGADIKVVQAMLGHRSAAMTLDQYGHLFSDRLDEVADALDRARLSETTPARSPEPGDPAHDGYPLN